MAGLSAVRTLLNLVFLEFPVSFQLLVLGQVGAQNITLLNISAMVACMVLILANVSMNSTSPAHE